MRATCIVLLVAACALGLADGWTTRRALLGTSTESNPLRRWLIRALGLNVGTVGVSVALCGGLVASYFLSSPSPSMIVSYGAVVGIYGVVLRGRSRWH